MQSNDPHHERRWKILGVIALAQLMVVLDVTIINIALPSAQADLGFSDDSRQWVITAYALSFGSLLLLGGKISDLIGRKWTFIAGLVGFAGASALGGAAPSFEVLVASRVLQGAFAALLAPAALSIVTTTFTDPGERAKAFGIYGAIAGSGAAIGLLLGGFLTELLTWRWTMYVNMAFAIPAADRRVAPSGERAPCGAPAHRHSGSRRCDNRPLRDRLRICERRDGRSGARRSPSASWRTEPLPLAAFIAIERRVKAPLLPLRVVSERNRGASFLAVAVAGVAMFSTFLFLTYYLQQGLGFSPIESGLAYLPMVAAIMVTATSSSTKLLPRVGPRPLIPTGMVLTALGLVYLTGIEVDSSYAGAILPGIIVMGVGFGLIMAPSFATATRGVEPTDAGVASAMVNTSQQVGGSLGVALLSTVFADAVSGYTAAVGTPAALAQAEAAVHGNSMAFWWAAGILMVGAIVTALMFEPGPAEATEHGAASLAVPEVG